MKAHFVVVVGEQSYPVVVRYEPNEFVAQVKELIVTSQMQYFRRKVGKTTNENFRWG